MPIFRYRRVWLSTAIIQSPIACKNRWYSEGKNTFKFITWEMNWSAYRNQYQSHFIVCGLYSVAKLCSASCINYNGSGSMLHCWTSSQGSHQLNEAYTQMLHIDFCCCFFQSIRPLCCTLNHRYTHTHTRIQTVTCTRQPELLHVSLECGTTLVRYMRNIYL